MRVFSKYLQGFFLVFVAAVFVQLTTPAQVFANCPSTTVLGYPAWYNGLTCESGKGVTYPMMTDLSDIWIVVMNIIQWLIITAGYAAVFFIIIAGFQYITAHGESSRIAEAKTTIINAIIGLVVALVSVAVVRTIQAAMSGSIT